MRSFVLFGVLGLALSVSGNAGDFGGKVPNFHARTLQGKSIQLRRLVKTGPVLLNFWAMWCTPCQRELPYLSQLAGKYREHGLTVLAISEDGEQATPRVRSFVEGRRFKFTVVVDRNQELFRLLRISVLPTSLLVDQNLKVVWQHVGYRPGDEREMERAILDVLQVP